MLTILFQYNLAKVPFSRTCGRL